VTKEEAFEQLHLGYIIFDDVMFCYWVTWKAFHSSEEVFTKASEAAKLLNKQKGEL
jgi:hypothetical protein